MQESAEFGPFSLWQHSDEFFVVLATVILSLKIQPGFDRSNLKKDIRAFLDYNELVTELQKQVLRGLLKG
jgi:hypothetical protein